MGGGGRRRRRRREEIGGGWRRTVTYRGDFWSFGARASVGGIFRVAMCDRPRHDRRSDLFSRSTTPKPGTRKLFRTTRAARTELMVWSRPKKMLVGRGRLWTHDPESWSPKNFSHANELCPPTARLDGHSRATQKFSRHRECCEKFLCRPTPPGARCVCVCARDKTRAVGVPRPRSVGPRRRSGHRWRQVVADDIASR